MSNDLVFVTVAVGIVIALRLARFTFPDAQPGTILERMGRVVHAADPGLRARISLQELQRPASSVQRADESEVGR